MHGTNSIVTFCDVTRASDLQPVLISKELLVELVGIEPTTSSLRIISVDKAADSSDEHKPRNSADLRHSQVPKC